MPARPVSVKPIVEHTKDQTAEAERKEEGSPPPRGSSIRTPHCLWSPKSTAPKGKNVGGASGASAAASRVGLVGGRTPGWLCW